MREIVRDRDQMGRPAPQHVAIIMDGNGRWARARNLPRVVGHRAGVEALQDILEVAGDLGIRYLSLFVFSTENWSRPASEVSALMRLLVEYVDRYLDDMHRRGVRIGAVGNIDALPGRVRDQINRALSITAGNDKIDLILALNYGGRDDIVKAAAALANDVKQGKMNAESITEDIFSSYLYTRGRPDPDLVIRTSGELRLSNYYLWQAAYSELWTTPVLWPDFSPEHLREAVREYRARERRYGGLSGEG